MLLLFAGGVYTPPPPEGVYDRATGDQLFPKVNYAVSGYASPLTAYSAWATELGVSSSATLSNISGVGGSVLDLGFVPTMAGTNTHILISSASGVSFFRATSPNYTLDLFSSVSVPAWQTPPGSLFTTTTPPSVTLMFARLGQTNRIFDGKWQTTGSSAILYGKWANNADGAYPTEMAVRLRHGGSFDLVILAATDSSFDRSFLQLLFDESGTLATSAASVPTGYYSGPASWVPNVGTTYQITAVGAPLAEGFAAIAFGTPAVCSFQATGILAAVAGTPTAGAYPVTPQGFLAVGFGAPNSAHVVKAEGVQPAVFGAPTASASTGAASDAAKGQGFVVAFCGMPRVPPAPKAQGFSAVRAGVPVHPQQPTALGFSVVRAGPNVVAYRPATVQVGTYAKARGTNLTVTGVPVLGYRAGANAFDAAHVGNTAAKHAVSSTGFFAARVGSAIGAHAGAMVGAAAARISTPNAVGGVRVVGGACTNFGAPHAYDPRAHVVAAARVVRIGAPRANVPIIHRAYGFVSGKGIGQPRSRREP